MPENRLMTLISVYDPTMSNSEEMIIAFYEDIHLMLSKIPQADKILLLGDFNVRVGTNHESWDPVGRFGLGKVNSSNLHLLQLCTNLSLAICNTFFQQKEIHKVTWIHPRSCHGHIIDYIICCQRDRQHVCSEE